MTDVESAMFLLKWVIGPFFLGFFIGYRIGRIK